ncbi:MAG: PQQ-binding-like beta-propeller repeat protein [Planctomycetota bacterium]|nr:PQQ-binding-like beta-propeller repeat protein [Planctomycetota bacterium]
MAASTEFTYQGQLKDTSGPVTGSFDFQFSLFDAATGGTQIGTTLTRSGVTVTGGLFTIPLDFGTSVFVGADRYLDIAVKPSSGAAFSALAGRQKLTATPYALYSISASMATPSGPAGGAATAHANRADKDSGNASENRAAVSVAVPPASPAAGPGDQPPAPTNGNGKAALLDAPGEWPQWGGPHRNGVSTEKGLYREWPAGGPTILWRTKLGRGLGTPAVWGNEVYLVVAEGWSNEEALSCVDAATGKEKWRLKFFTREPEGFGWAVGGPRATPAITENHVFALGAMGTLCCVDRTTGKKVWDRDLYGDYMLPGKGEWKGFCGSPVVFGNTVIVHGGAFKQFCVALDTATGKEFWKFYPPPCKGTFGGIGGTPALMLFADEPCVVFGYSLGLGALRISDGKEVWFFKHQKSGGPTRFPPVLMDNLIANMAQEEHFHMLEVDRSAPPFATREVWEKEIYPFSSEVSSFVPYEGYLYGFGGGQFESGKLDTSTANLMCVEPKTGKIVWETPGFRWGMSLSLVDGLLFVRSYNNVRLVEATPKGYVERGKLESFHKEAGSLNDWIMPVVTRGRMYLKTSWELVCVKVGDGSPGTQVGSEPAAAPQTPEAEKAPVPADQAQTSRRPAETKVPASVPAVRPATEHDWPQWRGLGRDGLSADVPTQLPEKKLFWQQPLASKNPAGLSVACGFVVAACHVGNEDQVRCFTAEKGDLLWTYSVGNNAEMDGGPGPRATPLIHDGRVYSVSAVGECCCLDLAKGALLWKRSFTQEFKGRAPTWGHCSSPVIADGKLIVSPMGPGAGIAALDPKTGATLWQTRGDGQPHASFIVSTFGEVIQIVGYDGPEIAGWDLATGKKLWGVRPEKDNDYNVGTPLAVDGKLLVATENNGARLYAFEKGGKVIPKPVATNEGFSPPMSTPVCLSGLVFGGSSDLLCLDAKTLKTLWTESKEEAVTGFTMLIGGKERLLVLNEEGELALLAAKAGKCELLGKMKVCGKTQSHPALADGKLFVRDAKTLYCYDLRPPERARSER